MNYTEANETLNKFDGNWENMIGKLTEFSKEALNKEDKTKKENTETEPEK